MNTKHLKAKILDLAIRGKLVPQNPQEGNAADLLKEHDDIPKDDIPFEIPKNWCWCRIKEIAQKITDGEHNTPKRVNAFQGYYLLSARNIQNGHLSLNDVDYVDEKEFNRIFARCNPQKGDVLISCSGSVGRCAIIEDDNQYVMVRSAAMISSNKINTKYLMFIIQSPELQRQIQYAAKQTAQANLFQGAISNLIISLPPLAEQQRIVSAIEKAFEQIDIIEKNKLNLKTYIKQTKNKVLDLAIRGKLVPQNPQEGNAADLLKEHNDIPEDEIPFEIPKNWCWCQLDKIFDFIGGGTPDKSKKEFWNGDIAWASVKDIKGQYLNKTIDTITPKGLKAGSSLCNKNELILVTRISPGKVIISNIETAINQDLKIARLKFQLNKEYLRYCFNYFEQQMYHDASGSTVKGIKIDYLNTFLFPIPPLSEQERIVERIEQIFEQLDILEKLLGE